MSESTAARSGLRRWIAAALIATAGLGAEEASAQVASGPAVIQGPVPQFSLNDLQLGEGEQIVSAGDGENVFHFEGGNYQRVDPSAVPTVAGQEFGTPGMPNVVEGFPMTGVPGGMPGGGMPARECTTCPSSGPLGMRRGHSVMGGHPTGGVDYGGHPRLGAGGDVCGPTCRPYRYASFDALYMANDSVRNFVGVAPFSVPDYDYELGGRYTIGSVPDCRRGWEFSFVGPFRWRSENERVGPPNFDSFLVPGLPIDATELSSFEDATAQHQRFDAEYFSFEVNRTIIGWDVVKLLYGIRYVQYEEDFFFTSLGDNGTELGLLRSETENRMIGAQIGADFLYPITCRMWSEFRGRAGLFANFAENTFQLNNDTDLVIFNGDDRVRAAGLFELGGGLRYYLTNNFSIRGGGELWYITEVARAADQFTAVMTPGTGRGIRTNGDVFMFGATAGAEWRF